MPLQCEPTFVRSSQMNTNAVGFVHTFGAWSAGNTPIECDLILMNLCKISNVFIERNETGRTITEMLYIQSQSNSINKQGNTLLLNDMFTNTLHNYRNIKSQ